jgi:nucleotide-binding universal stress UspA family protein
MKILLAVDASPDSKNAARMVRHFADPVMLDVLNVVDEDALKHAYISPEMPAGYLEEYRKDVSEAAERVLHEMKQDLTDVCSHIRLIADTGDAAESILETAEESRSDLIVVGQRGMTATPSFLLGGVSQKVATYAPCSVLVAKESVGKLDRILVAVDGSDASHKAVTFLLCHPLKVPLHVTVVTVWPQREGEVLGRSPAGHKKSEFRRVIEHKGEELLDRIATELKAGPYTVTTELLQGDPAAVLLDATVRHQAQMVIVGSRGMKAIKRFLLGSVSEKMLVYAACSVLIVR